jgi:lincosamide nucleotidyltransferase A/C/D/E
MTNPYDERYERPGYYWGKTPSQICFRFLEERTMVPINASRGDMTVESVLWFLALFDELELTVWLDGGWGVDALLGRQTRRHADLDIIVASADSGRLVEALRQQGFDDIITDDRCERNFVMGHPEHGLVDFHVVERSPDGSGVYAPREVEWEISASELDGTGHIAGRPVRCMSPEYQIRSHAGYPLGDTDYVDMQALHERFGVPLLAEQIRRDG